MRHKQVSLSETDFLPDTTLYSVLEDSVFSYYVMLCLFSVCLYLFLELAQHLVLLISPNQFSSQTGDLFSALYFFFIFFRWGHERDCPLSLAFICISPFYFMLWIMRLASLVLWLNFKGQHAHSHNHMASYFLQLLFLLPFSLSYSTGKMLSKLDEIQCSPFY